MGEAVKQKRSTRKKKAAMAMATMMLTVAMCSSGRLDIAMGSRLLRSRKQEEWGRRGLLPTPWIPMAGARFPASTIGESEKKKTLPWLPSLEYYVQVELGKPSFAVLRGALNETVSGGLGEVDIFDLNLTEGPSPDSKMVGYVRGFTVETSYIREAAGSRRESRNVEVEVVSYDSGDGVNGTISMQGLILSAPNEISIVGGTGCFRGARGFALIDLFSNASFPYIIYHHSLFFLP